MKKRNQDIVKLRPVIFSLLFLFLGSPGALLSQEFPIELKACVSDEYGLPIANANVSLEGVFLKGTATDIKGCFYLEIDRLPIRLNISHLNYKDYSILLEHSEDWKKPFVLESSIQDLPDIVVRARAKIDTVYRKPYSVTDYVFFEEHLVLLACKSTIAGYSLILLDERDRELDDFSLKEVRAKSLYQSCDGKLYLITAANVKEILIADDHLEFGRSISRDDFSDGLANCVLANDSLVFFERYFYQGQALEYTGIKRYTEETQKVKLPLIENDRNIVLLIEETGNRMPWSGNVWEENISDRLSILRNSKYGLAGIMKIFYPPIYAPIHKVDSSICVFNHFASMLEYYSPEGILLKRVPIGYHQQKKWKKKIYFDPLQQRAYTSFDTPEGQSITGINLYNGELENPIEIPMDFIENQKVWNGYLYYLYRNRGRGEFNRKLHRVALQP